MTECAKQYYDIAKNHFNGRCPYTDKPCEDWNCNDCKVEQEEREWAEQKYYEED